MRCKPKRRLPQRCGRSSGRYFGVAQRVVGVRVSVGPTVHRDRQDVIRRAEVGARQHAAQLLPHIQFELLKAGRQ